MTVPRHETSRRLALRAALRSTLTAFCLVAGYFVLPLDVQFTNRTALALAGGMLLLAAIIAAQARAIARSPYPRLRGIEALATSVPLFSCCLPRATS